MSGRRRFTSGEVEIGRRPHKDLPTGYGSNMSNQLSSHVMTSREGGSNYRVSRVDTLNGYHNTITAAFREEKAIQ